MPRPRKPSQRPGVYDTAIGWRFTNPALANVLSLRHGRNRGKCGRKMENFREEQRRFGLQSQQYLKRNRPGSLKAGNHRARAGSPKASRWNLAKTNTRETSMEKLADLKPAFKEGNSDGRQFLRHQRWAAAALLMKARCKSWYGRPGARVDGRRALTPP